MKKLLLLLLIFCVPVISLAQYGRTRTTPEPRQYVEEFSEYELGQRVNERLAYYKKEFVLDEFETEVMRNMLLDFEKNVQAIRLEEGATYDQKQKSIRGEENKLGKELSIFLTEEELARFSELHFMEGNFKKEKRKNKRKKNDNR